jgi:hypothetical protein
VALVVLTLCALYPGLTSVFQGLYPWVTGQEFALLSQQGAFMDLSLKLGLPIWAPHLMKAAIGGAYLAGVPGLWAGDWPGSRRHGHHRHPLPHRVPRDERAPARLIALP